MAINASDLDKDLKEFEDENGTIKTVEVDDLAKFLHVNQEIRLSAGEAGEDGQYTRVKKFFDYLGVHVFLPWLRALTKVFNAFKGTVEKDYLKAERVQEKYDPESAEPMSGMAVAEAIQWTDTPTIWEGISMTGCYHEAPSDQFWKISLAAEIMRKVRGGGVIGGDQHESITENWYGNVRIFVRDLSTDKLYFISATEALKAMNGEFEPVPVLDFGALVAKDEMPPIRKGAGENSVETGTESNKADGARSFVGGNGATAPGSDGFSYGLSTKAGGKHSAAFNSNAVAAADDTFATGEGTYAGSTKQRVAGKYNEKDAEGKFADIVGNGKSDAERSNAYTLDWEGNAVYAGSVSGKDGKLTTKAQVLEALLDGATMTKTIYIPVAGFNDYFILTEEMKENGLVIRKNAIRSDPTFGVFTIYNPAGDINSEPPAPAPTEAGGIAPFDVSGYEVGSLFLFYGGNDHPTLPGSLEVQMPVTHEYVSKAKLQALLSGEVSEG